MRPALAPGIRVLLIVASLLPGAAFAAVDVSSGSSVMSRVEMEEFLRSAEVRGRKKLGVGVTGSQRLKLSDGTVEHDAHFQSVDSTRRKFTAGGRTYLNFRDSYKYNIAAYRLDRMLGLDMAPVSVERRLDGEWAAVSWWVDEVQMMEIDRIEKGLQPPDGVKWSRQVRRARLFTQWIGNVDANATNILITNEWDLRLIDFTRAFRSNRVDLAKLPSRIERDLFERLQELTVAELEGELGDLLTRPEFKSLIARRGEIVRYYSDLISQRGEAIVLLEATEPTSSLAGRVATADGHFLPGITFRSDDEVIVR